MLEENLELILKKIGKLYKGYKKEKPKEQLPEVKDEEFQKWTGT
ncbi:25418_t:CDS:2 [Gigaspora margarita]|uniref:25418_t:CDS:1 n=1 Tax=Gigaspora margarita TaxID=4874 RepID=A0ABM8W1Q3_GIGMA|nr:25418_t:CDS:2 [Gigaspora margarita]